MLDDKDKLILEYLMHDCRITTKKLAKLTNLSQPSIVYRIKKLEKENYILQYDVLLDYNKFDIPMVVFFINVPNSKKEEFTAWCYETKRLVHSLISHTNFYNYSITSILKKDEINELKNKLKKSKFEYFYHICTEHYKTVFSIYDLNINYTYPEYKETQLKLDNIDAKILNRLQYKGAKDSILELAKNTGLTYDLTLYRYKKLKKAGYLKLFFAQINHKKFHLQSDVIIFEVKTREDVVKKITNIQKGLFFVKLEGNKYCLTFFSKNMQEYKSIIKRIVEELDDNLIELKEYMIDEMLFLNKFDLSKVLEKQR